jgi:hypothetical protein
MKSRVPRVPIVAQTYLKEYDLIWDFSPSATAKHETTVIASSLQEAFDALTDDVSKLIGVQVDLDIWEK